MTLTRRAAVTRDSIAIVRMRRISFCFLALGMTGALSAAPAAAHDFWIRPDSFRVATRQALPLYVYVGEGFAGEAVAGNPPSIRRFVALGAGGSITPVTVRGGAVPAGMARFAAPGFQIIGLRTHRWAIELDAQKFETYLREEGLEHIIEIRKANGHSAAPGREWYSRCAKSIVIVDAERAALGAGFDRALGMRLELIPETNPAALAAGAVLSLRLLFEGKPRPGVLVRATNENAREAHVLARTDARGRVRFLLDKAGPWLFTGVHMIPARDDLWTEAPAARRPPEDADWESLWASLTLEVAAPQK